MAANNIVRFVRRPVKGNLLTVDETEALLLDLFPQEPNIPKQPKQNNQFQQKQAIWEDLAFVGRHILLYGVSAVVIWSLMFMGLNAILSIYYPNNNNNSQEQIDY